MKWYEREFGFEGQPYRLFLADVVWSGVAVILLSFILFLMSAGLPVIAVGSVATSLLLGPMIVRRTAEHRASLGLVRRRPRGVTPVTRSRQLADGT
jgi:hypothetical protein